MSTPENPPAFPVNTANLGGEGAHQPDSGMGLHDWYVGKILQGFAANPAVFAHNASSGWGLVNCTEVQLVDYARNIAGIVVAARNRAGEEGR